MVATSCSSDALFTIPASVARLEPSLRQYYCSVQCYKWDGRDGMGQVFAWNSTYVDWYHCLQTEYSRILKSDFPLFGSATTWHATERWHVLKNSDAFIR